MKETYLKEIYTHAITAVLSVSLTLNLVAYASPVREVILGSTKALERRAELEQVEKFLDKLPVNNSKKETR